MVFALSSEEEVKRKPFLVRGNLVKSLSKHTRAIASKSGLHVFHFDEKKQTGNSFGTRFSNAVQDVFDRGYDSVIAIGNDCPHIEISHIHQAKAILDQNEAVLGPTYDGGFYLMGIAKKDFEHTTFLQLPWNTNTVFEDFLIKLQTRGIECRALEKLWDINYLSTLHNLVLRSIQNVRLRTSIQVAIKGPVTHYFISKLRALRCFHSTRYNKGSPFMYSIY